jgi:hypothetical protein
MGGHFDIGYDTVFDGVFLYLSNWESDKDDVLIDGESGVRSFFPQYETLMNLLRSPTNRFPEF